MLSQIETLPIDHKLKKFKRLKNYAGATLERKSFSPHVAFVIESEIGLREQINHSGMNFTFVPMEQCFASFHGRLPDLILVSSNLANEFGKHLNDLRSFANKNFIPLLLYSPGFEKIAQNLALSYHFDDYYFGNLSKDFFKRISFYKKLKRYKVKHRGSFASKYRRHYHQGMFVLKRLIDVVVSGTALILFAPLLLVIALLVKLESRGPVFYVSKRAGAGYKVFDFYKFRSMRQGADAELNKLLQHNQYGSTFFKMKDDPRITRFGDFLRRTSLDELPQLINVLKGDMSLVGNRPLPLYEATQLTKDKTAWRFIAPAGITGLWQILKRGKEEMSDEERINLDVEYAKNSSLLLDMSILYRTFPALMQKTRV